jgi:hypothetical protein
MPRSQVTLGAAPEQDGAAPTTGVPDAPSPAGRCRWYLPDSSSLDRYLWSLQWLVANGFYVLAEYRPSSADPTAASADAFVDAWRWLWGRVACLPNFESDLAGRVFVKLLAAPDSTGHRWEPITAPEGTEQPGGEPSAGVKSRLEGAKQI